MSGSFSLAHACATGQINQQTLLTLVSKPPIFALVSPFGCECEEKG